MSTPDDELPPDATVAARLSTYLRGGGIITPIITVLFAFLVGGLVVLSPGTTRSRPTARSSTARG